MPFIGGLVCDSCGVPLPGEQHEMAAVCDSCLAAPKPWAQGRAALLYEGTARRMVLGLKHGDRHDMVRPLASWMAARAGGLISADTLVAPVPLHWRRMLSRRFNQAAMLAKAVAQKHNVDFCPDLLLRNRATVMQEGMTREERFENQRRAFQVPPKRVQQIAGKTVLLVDDVMTSGATLGSCTEACYAANAKLVNVLVLARVARDT